MFALAWLQSSPFLVYLLQVSTRPQIQESNTGSNRNQGADEQNETWGGLESMSPCRLLGLGVTWGRGGSQPCSPWPGQPCEASGPWDNNGCPLPNRLWRNCFPGNKVFPLLAPILFTCFLTFQKIQLAFDSKLWVLLDISSQVANRGHLTFGW